MKIPDIIKALIVLCVAINAIANPQNNSFLLDAAQDIALNTPDDYSLPDFITHAFQIDDSSPPSTATNLDCQYSPYTRTSVCNLNFYEKSKPTFFTTVAYFNFFSQPNATTCVTVDNSKVALYQYIQNPNRFHLTATTNSQPDANNTIRCPMEDSVYQTDMRNDL